MLSSSRHGAPLMRGKRAGARRESVMAPDLAFSERAAGAQWCTADAPLPNPKPETEAATLCESAAASGVLLLCLLRRLWAHLEANKANYASGAPLVEVPTPPITAVSRTSGLPCLRFLFPFLVSFITSSVRDGCVRHCSRRERHKSCRTKHHAAAVISTSHSGVHQWLAGPDNPAFPSTLLQESEMKEEAASVAAAAPASVPSDAIAARASAGGEREDAAAALLCTDAPDRTVRENHLHSSITQHALSTPPQVLSRPARGGTSPACHRRRHPLLQAADGSGPKWRSSRLSPAVLRPETTGEARTSSSGGAGGMTAKGGNRGGGGARGSGP